MKHIVRAGGMVGAVFAAVPVVGAPPAFDQWSVNNGNIAAGCGAGANCEILTSGPGFMQRRVDAPGQSFVQTIVTAPGATGVAAGGLAFSDESFTLSNPTIQGGTQSPQTTFAGLADRQLIHTQNAATAPTMTFDSSTTIRTGWAAVPGEPNIDIAQSITERNAAGESFKMTSRIKGNNDANGNQTGTSMALSTELRQPENGDGQQSGGEDVQVFELRRVGGNMLTAAGSATLNSSTVRWNPNDVAQVVWIGQAFDLGSFAEGGFTFQSFDNLSDSVDAIRRVTQSNNGGPFAWADPPFGTRPVMPAVSSGGGSGGGGWGGR